MKPGIVHIILLVWSFAGIELHAAATPRATLPSVRFSVPRGLYERPFDLRLASPRENASVRYTLDGSEPTADEGIAYVAPLFITNTTLLRAAAFEDRTRVSAVGTHSYLLLEQVLRQPSAPPGLPSGAEAWNGEPSAYQMDPRVVDDPLYRGRIHDAFRSLPIVSIVGRRPDLFGPDGLYLNTLERGTNSERACSTEMVLTNGQSAFQIDAALRIQGNMNRVPDRSPKHAFRLLFKSAYGPGKLRYPLFPDSSVSSFNTLVLRADYNNSWIHSAPEQAVRGQRIRDAWMKDTARAMGWVAPHNRFVHLFLNGLYWGVYDFTERPDAEFAEDYFGKSREGYDVVNSGELKEGGSEAFEALTSLSNLHQPDQYQKLQRLLNITNYIDYLLLHYYAGNLDWGDHKNCYLIRRRSPSGVFNYVVWDGEHVLNGSDDNVANPTAGLLPIASQLRNNEEFRRLFVTRVQKHCFGDGALTPRVCAERWSRRAAEVSLAMVAESARWGYIRRNPPFSRDADYLPEQSRLLMLYFPQRTGVLLRQLENAGLHSLVKAPSSSQP